MTLTRHREPDGTSSPSSRETATSGPREVAGHRPSIKWAALAAFLLVAAVAVYATLTQGVSSIDVNNGTINFIHGAASSQQVSPQQLSQEQSQLASKAAEAEQQASQSVSPAASAPEIWGRWSTSVGLVYDIAQYADQIVIQEISPYGVTAVAWGAIQGRIAAFDFQALNGMTGQGQLEILDEGTLRAVFNSAYGSNEVMLAR